MHFHDSAPRSLAFFLIVQAETRPEALALWQGKRQLNYQQLLQRVRSTAAGFARLGLSNAAVALLFQNTIDCVITFLALAWLQARLVPLEPEISSERLVEMQEEIGFSWLAGHSMALRAFASSPLQVQRVPIDERADQADLDDEFAPVMHQPDTVFVYHYTSGSTGLPKAAMHSQENLIRGGLIYQATFHIKTTDRILAAVPVLHSFGMVGGMIAAIVTGASLILCERFVPRRVLQLASDVGATMLLAVPLMYDLMSLAQPPASLDLSALRLCLSTGGALPEAVTKRFLSCSGKEIYHVYGSSESGIISAQRPSDAAETRFSVGQLVEGVEARAIDGAQQVLPAGEEGILEVRTPAMFQGYLNNSQATAGVLHDGWYRSQDIGRVQEEGYLYLCGRKETFINVGGKKVNPLEVELVLCAHPSVKEAVVWGAVTENASESVRASVVLSAPVSVADIIAFCRTRLPVYQVPVSLAIVSNLPRTAMGKIQRFGSER